MKTLSEYLGIEEPIDDQCDRQADLDLERELWPVSRAIVHPDEPPTRIAVRYRPDEQIRAVLPDDEWEEVRGSLVPIEVETTVALIDTSEC